MTHSLTDTRKQLRKQLRARRRTLSRSQQRQATHQLIRQLSSHPVFLRSKRIAFYMADDGEMNVCDLMSAAEKMGKQCYLPILHPLKQNELWFGPYQADDALLANRFGLAEPSTSKSNLPAWVLDLVLMPLVGFDRKGNRLGMGGGFYDRTFSFKKTAFGKNNSHRPRCPILMGVAHHCQEVMELSSESWDIALDYVATDKEIIAVS